MKSSSLDRTRKPENGLLNILLMNAQVVATWAGHSLKETL